MGELDRIDTEGPARSVPQPLRGPFTLWPRLADAVLAGVVFVLTVFQGSFEDPATAQGFNVDLPPGIPAAAYLAVAAASAALLLRRSQPLPVLAANVLTSLAWVGFGYSEDPLFGVLVALYSVGRFAELNRVHFLATGGMMALIAVSDLVAIRPISEIGVNLLVMLLAWYVGRRIHIRREYVSVLHERGAYQQREREAEARQVVADERARIARELHDVVAHRVSMMTVQAGAAKTIASKDPKGAVQAMEAVEQAGRMALDELRHMLGVLRPTVTGDELGPQPGVDDIPRLVEQLGQTGLVVELTIDEMPEYLPARVELSTYRIVQEALTNVLKHAGPDAGAEVDISAQNGHIAVAIRDHGSGVTILPGSGHGIVGMQERAHLLGGSLQAGPRPGGGFEVLARLPVGGTQE